MTVTANAGSGTELRQIAARLERLPYSSWHRNMRLIICSAWFFDAFDSITIAVRRHHRQPAAPRLEERGRKSFEHRRAAQQSAGLK